MFCLSANSPIGNITRLEVAWSRTPPNLIMSIVSTSAGRVGNVLADGSFQPFISNAPDFLEIAQGKGNRLFGAVFRSGASTLYQLNASSGTVTAVGSSSPYLNALGFAGKKLYGAGDSGFYSINQTTGATSKIATIRGFQSSGDLVFVGSKNRFYATSRGASGDVLFSIDLKGRAQKIGGIGFGGVYGLAAFTKNIVRGYTVQNQEIKINLKTGKGTFVRTLNLTGAGLIFGAT